VVSTIRVNKHKRKYRRKRRGRRRCTENCLHCICGHEIVSIDGGCEVKAIGKN